MIRSADGNPEPESEPVANPAPESSGLRDDSFVGLIRDCLVLFDGSTMGRKIEAERASEGAALLARDSEPGPGLIPSDRFALIGEVGRGSFGVVYRARDRVLGRDVAIKVPRPELILSAEARRRFRREARTLAILDHPNLVPVLEAGVLGPTCYIVSPFCDGPNLADWLQSRSGPVPWRDAARTLSSLAGAVAHAHDRGVLHRDIKPSNILLFPEGPDGAGTLPRLGDFGLACLVEEIDDQTLSGLPLGSPPYMPPEQASGQHRDVGPGADVYSLGATLHEILAGQPPFQGPSLVETLRRVLDDEPKPLRSIRPDLPRDLETIALRCLQKDPGRRYASAHLLKADLDRLLDGVPIAARAVGPVERLGRWARRPARIRDAGQTLTALGLTLTILGLSYMVAAVLGLMVPPLPWLLIRELTCSISLFDLPMVVAGFLILHQNRVGPWFGLVTSLAFLVSVTYSLTVRPVFTFGGLLDEKSPRNMFEWLMFLIAAYGTVMSAVAIVAAKDAAHRRRTANPASPPG